jgi:hypothetical protein
VAKFEVEVLEKAFVSVKKTLTLLLFAVDQKFHFATSLKFLSPSSHLQSGANNMHPVIKVVPMTRNVSLKWRQTTQPQ